ncbi:MAG: ABC transporter permease [Candidatus Riflebacteria bacterium]|nr:ABC transporter permease [Candidatus Riflebacteria bacterium]
MNDSLTCLLREFSRNRTRAVSNFLGYFLVVSMMVGIGHLLLFSRDVEGEILQRTGVHFMGFVPLKSDDTKYLSDLLLDPDNEGFAANSVVSRLVPIDYAEKIKNLPGVKDSSPFLLFRYRNPISGFMYNIGGFDLANQSAVGNTCCAKSDVISGEYLKASGSAMLEIGFAMSHGLKTGMKVTISGEEFPIAAIVDPGIRPVKADIYLAYEDAERVIGKRLKQPLKGSANIFLIEAKSSTVQLQAIEDVKKLLDGSVGTTYSCFKPAIKALGINSNSVWLLILLIGGGTFLFSLKSQISSVIERQRDFGILKAIGWSDRNVMIQVILESSITSFSGGFFGCIAGLLMYYFAPFETIFGMRKISEFIIYYPSIVFAGIFFSSAGGISAGLIAGYISLRQSTVAALRPV